MSDVKHRKRGLGFEKSQWVEFLPRRRMVDFRGSPRPCSECRTWWWWWWGRWKNQHRKIVNHSPYVEKPLNSKVIKSFLPELRSRQVSFVFRDSYVIYIYIYMWVMDIMNVLRTGINMSISHIQVWLCYTNSVNKKKTLRKIWTHIPHSWESVLLRLCLID